MQRIVFLGGPPTVGKSSFAKKLSQKYNLPWISTDLIRDWMARLVSPEKYPDMFLEQKYTADDFWTNYEVDGAIQQELARDKNVFDGIKSFIEENDQWEAYFMEGISIHPSMIYELEKIKDVKILFLYLIESDLTRIRKTIYERGLWGPAETYADWIKEKEVLYVEKFNEWYLSECEKHKVQYFFMDADYDKTFLMLSGLVDSFL